MGKVVLAAVVAAVVSALVTAMVLGAFSTEDAARREEAAKDVEKALADEREKVGLVLERLDRFEKRFGRTGGAREHASEPSGDDSAEASGSAVAPGAGTVADASGRLVAPDGTPYVSRADLEKALAGAAPAAFVPPEPVAKKSLDEIAADMGLSAGEEANLRVILRQQEEEALQSLFGDVSIDQVKLDVAAARDDPEKQGAMLQSMVMRGFQNVGKLATLERRTRKKVEALLGEERASDFLRRPRKSVLDPELEDIVEHAFK